MARNFFDYPWTGALCWTGEVQSLAIGTTSTAATEITVPGNTFFFYATKPCYIVLGNAGIHAASATAKNRCFPVPHTYPPGLLIHVPTNFRLDSAGVIGKLYVRALASDTGVLYIASAGPNEEALLRGATSTTTTTTSTTTTT